jgi:hypothetical protein
MWFRKRPITVRDGRSEMKKGVRCNAYLRRGMIYADASLRQDHRFWIVHTLEIDHLSVQTARPVRGSPPHHCRPSWKPEKFATEPSRTGTSGTPGLLILEDEVPSSAAWRLAEPRISHWTSPTGFARSRHTSHSRSGPPNSRPCQGRCRQDSPPLRRA